MAGSHGGNFEDDPSLVHRGKWIRENLLCDYVPPLSSVKVVAKVGRMRPNKNARAAARRGDRRSPSARAATR